MELKLIYFIEHH